MVRKRLTMKKIKEVLRLKYEAGLSNRAIAGTCKISNRTVGDYLRRAADAGLGWPCGRNTKNNTRMDISIPIFVNIIRGGKSDKSNSACIKSIREVKKWK